LLGLAKDLTASVYVESTETALLDVLLKKKEKNYKNEGGKKVRTISSCILNNILA